MAIILVFIDDYFINGYWWLLVIILGYIMSISAYCIMSLCCLFYVILWLLVIILS